MKQNQNFVTKDDLLEALESFSKKIRVNLRDLRQDLRQEIYQEILASEKRLEIKFDIKFEQMEHRLNDNARKLQSDVLTRFDSFA